MRRHGSNAKHRAVKAPLIGKLFDATGEPMSPAASRGKSGRAYRYYVSAPLQQGLRADDPFAVARSAHLSDRGLQLTLDTAHCANLITRLADNEITLDRASDGVTILLPIIFPARGGRSLVEPAQVRPPQPDRFLIAALRKAHAMLGAGRGLPTWRRHQLLLTTATP